MSSFGSKPVGRIVTISTSVGPFALFDWTRLVFGSASEDLVSVRAYATKSRDTPVTIAQSPTIAGVRFIFSSM